MPDYQKRHIAVSPDERRYLEKAKQRFEAKQGQSDWGAFLTAIAAAGLATLGVYGLAELVQRTDRSVRVRCPDCYVEFTLALPVGPRGPVQLVEFDCPQCGAELVLDLAEPREA